MSENVPLDQQCPACGKQLPVATPLFGTVPVIKPGNFGTCTNCFEVLVVDENLKLRLAKPADYANIPPGGKAAIKAMREHVIQEAAIRHGIPQPVAVAVHFHHTDVLQTPCPVQDCQGISGKECIGVAVNEEEPGLRFHMERIKATMERIVAANGAAG